MVVPFFARPLVVLLVAALVSVSWEGVASASEPEYRTESAVETREGGRPIAASALRLASTESYRLERTVQSDAADSGGRGGASIAEKVAFVYLLVGGSIFLVTSPGEKVDGHWTNDAASETIGGAGAVAISFFLLRDILKKRPPAARP